MGPHSRPPQPAPGHGPKEPTAPQAVPAQGEPQPPGAQQALGEPGLKGISFDEQVRIIGELDEVLRKNRLQANPDTFAFTPRKKGAVLPILIDAGALLLTLAAVAGIVLSYNAGERTLVRRSSVLVTAEGKLIQAVKKESEQQLLRKDRELSRIRDSMQALVQDRDRIRLESRAELARREAEMKARMDKELAEERQRLKGSGLAPEEVGRRVAALEASLKKEGQQQLAEYQNRVEGELAVREAELAALRRQYTDSQQAFRREQASLQAQLTAKEAESARLAAGSAAAASEQTRLAAELARLEQERQRERLVSDQLTAAYTKVMEAGNASQPERALRSLDSVRELLSRESVASLPALRSRLPVERFLVDSLARLFESQTGGARQEAGAASTEKKRRETQGGQLADLMDRLESSRSAAGESQEKVLSLLETKLRVRQALSTEPLRSRYPGLYEQLERYLDAYGLEQRQEGQAGALKDVTAVLEGLASKSPRLDSRRLAADYAGRLREPFSRFLERLREVLK